MTTTGDNDPSWEPQPECRRYVYCDQCGAFAMEIWLSPRNYPWILAWVKWLDRAASLFMWIGIYAAIVSALWWLIELLTGGFEVFWFPLFLTGCFIGFAFFVACISTWVDRCVQTRGLHCKACDAYYENGDVFFQKLDENPRGYTIDDVPRPEPYWLPGSVDEGAEFVGQSRH